MNPARFSYTPDDEDDDPDDEVEEVDADLWDRALGHLRQEEIDNLSDEDLRKMLDASLSFDRTPISLTTLILLGDADQVEEYLQALDTEPEFLEALMRLHWTSEVREGNLDPVRAFDWFESRGLDVGRYAMYLHRQFHLEQIERLEDLLEVVRPSILPRLESAISRELTELARLEDLCPGDP
jgi:hypothetical protein